MKKRILLILPKNCEINFINVSSIIRLITRRSGGPIVLSLATVAALTPSDFEVRIVDEDVEEVDFDEPFDIVGIGRKLFVHFRHTSSPYRCDSIPWRTSTR